MPHMRLVQMHLRWLSDTHEDAMAAAEQREEPVEYKDCLTTPNGELSWQDMNAREQDKLR